jgi:hypothetical protein
VKVKFRAAICCTLVGIDSLAAAANPPQGLEVYCRLFYALVFLFVSFVGNDSVKMSQSVVMEEGNY